MNTAKHIWMDGEFVDWDAANVHVLTHALHYGTGVFEGIRAYATDDGPAVFRLREHMERLHRSAKAYQMEVEFSVDELCDATTELIRRNELASGYIRPLVYLELGAIGLNPANARVRTAIASWEWGAYLGEDGIRNGIRVRVSSWRRFRGDMFPNAKATGTYINSILAKSEAIQTGYDEGIMLNADGVISEGTGENLFLVADGIVYTPPLSTGCLDGITRGTVITLLSEEGYEVMEKNLLRSDLYYADEIFLTGTAAEVTPVREVDDRAVGTGTPGPVTRFAQERYAAVVSGKVNSPEGWLTRV